jgi:hypothetical protein
LVGITLILVKLAGVVITALTPDNTLSMRYPEEVKVSIVNEETGWVDDGLVKIDCTCRLKGMPAVAPEGIVKLMSEREELDAELHATVDSEDVPAEQEVAIKFVRLAGIAMGIPSLNNPLTGMLFIGVNFTV